MFEDDLQVFFHPLWVQILDGDSLHLERVRLEILKIAPKEDSVCRVNFLDTILGKSFNNFEQYQIETYLESAVKNYDEGLPDLVPQLGDLLSHHLVGMANIL